MRSEDRWNLSENVVMFTERRAAENETLTAHLMLGLISSVFQCARVMKDEIKLRLRETMRVIKIPSTEPYRAAVLDYLNRLFVSKREKCWHRVRVFCAPHNCCQLTPLALVSFLSS